MPSIDIHAHLIPQCFCKAPEGGGDWHGMDFDWPVSWVLGLESITQEEKEAILWKNLEGLLGI